VAHEHGGLPYWASVIALLLFASFHSFYIPVVGGLVWMVRKRLHPAPHLLLVVTALLTVLGEMHLTSIFPWHFGYTWLWAQWPAYHLAEFVGFQTLSGLSIVANVLTYFFFVRHDRPFVERARPVAALLVIFLILNGLGLWRYRTLPETDARARVLIVQANIGNQEKLAAHAGSGYRREIVSRFVELTSEGLAAATEPIDFILWPETAFPYRIGDHLLYRPPVRELREWIESIQVPLVTGAYYEDPRTEDVSNSIYIIGRDGLPRDTPYRKQQLLAFGEYNPISEWLPFTAGWFPAVANFARGAGPEVKQLDHLRLGTQICYEGLFPRFSYEPARLGAQLLVNVTNDSWYGPYSEPYQHLYMTLARAIEVRRPLIRSTNTGISTVVLADGRVLERSPLYKPWYGVYDIPFLREPRATIYQLWPWLPMCLWWVLAAVFFGKALRDRTRHD
jgi:apolipoprotein N-acyltransferase